MQVNVPLMGCLVHFGVMYISSVSLQKVPVIVQEVACFVNGYYFSESIFLYKQWTSSSP